MEHFTAAWLYDDSAGAYVNNTVEAEIADGTAFNFLGEAADYFYLGFGRRVDWIIFILTVAGSYDTLVWEYSDDPTDADSWTRLVPLTNSGLTYTTHDNYVRLRVPKDWASVSLNSTSPHSGVTPPDETARFWLRVSTATVTTVATIKEIQCIPYARYVTPEEVAAFLQIPDLSESTTPTFSHVEDRIHQAEARIDYLTKKSWRYNIKTDEKHEFNLDGIRLLRKDIRDVTGLHVWNGGGWDELDCAMNNENRSTEAFVVEDLGMLYFSRYFMLPARMSITGPRFWGWGVGEFTYPIRVSYIWGRDLDMDEQGPIVTELAAKMVAINLYRSHDYSILAVSGSDKIGLERKVDQWSIEIEDTVESLCSWEVM